jgi:glyoxylase-like metal-dependent hydrolase (beta-lactamase superfamily II)
MTAIRQAGKINENTTLIDIGMEGTYGMTALYLVQGSRKCLIDGGTRKEAPRLLKALRELDAFPPDLIILTHPHYDHTQGIPLLRREAGRQGKEIQVLASGEATPLLADASFNDILDDVFDRGPYESIRDVTPLNEGDSIDLGGLPLRIYDIPGHCRGHIAILDEVNRNIFVGDAIGMKVSDTIFFPPFMPPCWEPDAFLSSVDKLRQAPYDTLSLAHFGCIGGREGRSILDEAVATCNTWWQWYERHADRLDDTEYLLRAMREEINPGVPVLKPVSFGLRVMLGLMTALGTVTGKKTAMIDKLAFGDPLKWLATGYRMYNTAH